MSVAAGLRSGTRAGRRKGKSAAPAAPPLSGREERAASFALFAAEAGWLAILIAGPMAINPLGARAVSAPLLTVLAPLAALLAAAWLATVGRGCLAVAPARLPMAALGGFFAILAVSTLASESPWIAFFGNYLRREGAAAWLIAGLPLAAMLTLIRRREQAERVIDALLLGSVLPCVCALLQAGGWVVSALPWMRTGSTLGNPVFFADYLLLLIPLTLVRLIDAGSPLARAYRPAVRHARLAWLALLVLQALAMLLALSRGPLLSLAAALWLFAVMLAGIRRSRKLLLGALALLFAGCAAIAAINLVPQLGTTAATVPGLARFVYSGAADLSSVSRLGIWEAGVNTLLAAPPLRQLVGYGPDVAFFHYYAHLPAVVMQIEGPLDEIDRLHNECLELAATAGLAGLACYVMFVAAVLRLAGRALGGPQLAGGPAPAGSWLWFAALPLAGGIVVAIALATLAGRAALAPVGFGVGLGAVWALALARDALRGWRTGVGAPAPGGQVLVAGLAAAIVAFWIDAQVSLPVLATRLVLFAMVALLILQAGALGSTPEPGDRGLGHEGPEVSARLAGWSLAVVMIVAVVGFLPAPFGQIVTEPVLTSWTARVLVFAVPVLFAWALHPDADPVLADSVNSRAAASTFARQLGLAVLPFIAVYLGLCGLQDVVPADHAELALAAPIMWAWLWLPCCCLILAGRLARGHGEQVAHLPAARRVRMFPWAACLLVAAVAVGGWAELRADLLSKLAGLAQAEGRTDEMAILMARMSHSLPGERHYHLVEGTRRLERTVTALNSGHLDRAELAAAADQLRQAEADIRVAMGQAPQDPWVVFGLANVLQFEGLKALQPLMGGEGADKALEARSLFRRAHGIYPAQPTILRNWAELESDQGDLATAYALLDQMEALVPGSEEPYAERLRMAREAGDAQTIAATLARAAARLGPQAAARLAAASSR